MRYYAYNDPLKTDNPVIHQLSIISEEEAVKWARLSHPEGTCEDLLNNFIVVNWAWEVPEEIYGAIYAFERVSKENAHA